MKKYPGLAVGVIFGVIIAAVLFAAFGNEGQSDYDPDLQPNGQTVQEKYGCADDEVVYFGGELGIECVSHEEDTRRMKGDL